MAAFTPYINDWHTVIDFDPYKGYQLGDVPHDYYQWLEVNLTHGPVHEAISRIKSRRGVTKLIKLKKNSVLADKMPLLTLDSNQMIPIVNRPDDVDPSLFGYFIEHLVKYALGVTHFDDVKECLALYGPGVPPKHLTLEGPPLKPTKRIRFINNSYQKTSYDLLDICNFSFCPKILMRKLREAKACHLYIHVKNNLAYYQAYFDTIKGFKTLPRLDPAQQERCDKISVGCVIGVIDMIVDDAIIDIKCSSKETPESVSYYRKQLYTYACLYLLRYGTKMKCCRIFNFLTSNVYSMDVSQISYEEARKYIRALGNHCPAHLKLLS